jgi:hypothetical protein
LVFRCDRYLPGDPDRLKLAGVNHLPEAGPEPGTGVQAPAFSCYPLANNHNKDCAQLHAPRKLRFDTIVTPLSSIFGSGFLVIVPILAEVVGKYSVIAMALVCALAYAVGAVIRFNIRYAETLLGRDHHEVILSLERISDLALVPAYVISVCLYLEILSSFVIGGLAHEGPIAQDLLTTAIILTITVIGLWRGLEPLSFLEAWCLYITLGIIVVLFAGFGWHDFHEWKSAAGFDLVELPDNSAWTILTVVAGTLIVVQGFETTRYLGGQYDAVTRIRASRWSQIISTVIYIAFVALVTPIVAALGGEYHDNSLIDLTRHAVPFMVVPLIIAAALSQFSAAVADVITSVGNIEEATGNRIKSRFAYILVGFGAAMLTWQANTFELVALASRAFAFYYLMQCLVAICVTRSRLRRIGFALVALALAFIAIFAIPAHQ